MFRKAIPDTIGAFLSGVKYGKAMQHDNLTVYPLFSRQKCERDYIASTKAIKEAQIELTEVNQSASVSEIKAVNKGSRAVLFLEGEGLVGARQNRVLNTTVLLAPESETVIPVSCTESGRWSYKTRQFAVSDHLMSPRLRKSKSAGVTSKIANEIDPSFSSHQSEVWDGIHSCLNLCCFYSSTSAMEDLLHAKSQEFAEAIAREYPLQAGQCGLLAFVDGQAVGMDIIPRAEVYASYHDRLVRSHAFEASLKNTSNKQESSEQGARKFLDAATDASRSSYPSVGIGEDVRLDGSKVSGLILIDKPQQYEEPERGCASGEIIHAAVLEHETHLNRRLHYGDYTMNETIDYLENQWGKLMSTYVGEAINTLPRRCLRDLWNLWILACKAEGDGFPPPDDNPKSPQDPKSPQNPGSTLEEQPELSTKTDDEIQKQSIELLNRARSGDQEALVDLWNLHEAMLRSFLWVLNEKWKSNWEDSRAYPITHTWLTDALADFRGAKFFYKNERGEMWHFAHNRKGKYTGYNPRRGKYAAWLWVCLKFFVIDKSKRDFPVYLESLEKIFEERGDKVDFVRIQDGGTFYDCDMQEMRRLCDLLIKQTRACANEHVWWVLFLDALLPKLVNYRRRSQTETALWMQGRFKEKITEERISDWAYRGRKLFLAQLAMICDAICEGTKRDPREVMKEFCVAFEDHALRTKDGKTYIPDELAETIQELLGEADFNQDEEDTRVSGLDDKVLTDLIPEALESSAAYAEVRLHDLFAMSTLGPRTLGFIKEFGKRLRLERSRQYNWPQELWDPLYHVPYAMAVVHDQELPGNLATEKMRDGFDRCAELAWIQQDLRDVFKQAKEKLEG